jgi:rhodanese-related sulfurtransferase
VKKMRNEIQKYWRPFPIILLFSAVGCSAIAIMGMDVQTLITNIQAPHITVAELQQGKLKPVLLIDVRSPDEYNEDRIGKSPLVPLTEIEASIGLEQIRSLVAKSAYSTQLKPTVVLYCTKGPRSVKAYKLLKDKGLNIRVLSGGITAWRQTVAAEQDTTVLAPII